MAAPLPDCWRRKDPACRAANGACGSAPAEERCCFALSVRPFMRGAAAVRARVQAPLWRGCLGSKEELNGWGCRAL